MQQNQGCQMITFKLNPQCAISCHFELVLDLDTDHSCCREEVDLYRAVYSLLCSSGAVFPALVEDQEVGE